MIKFTHFSLLSVGLLLLSGCDNSPTGGAYQSTNVEVLPPDLGLGGGEDEADDADGAADDSASSEPGSLSGRVVLTGAAPTLAPTIAKGADVKDKEFCSAEELPDERLVLGADNGVANVFIYMAKPPKNAPKPEVSDEAVIFDQKNCRFLPHCLLVPVGQTVKVLNGDGAAHNTHTYGTRNEQINQGVAANDRDGKLQIVYKKSERAPLSVKCDLHGWMSAWHFPVDHPYVALTDADGNFEIPDLPAGEHTFVVWHEAAKGKFVNRKFKVSIQPGETTSEEIEYAASLLEL